jgi:hypothetical protein
MARAWCVRDLLVLSACILSIICAEKTSSSNWGTAIDLRLPLAGDLIMTLYGGE